jgi:tetratricopeptide (TPR) repeat protein
MLRLYQLIFLFCISLSIKGQLRCFENFRPRIDTTDLIFADFIKSKNFESGVEYLDKIIRTNPTVGLNYFNRALLNFYQKEVAEGEIVWNNTLVDTLIYNDCIRAMHYNFKTPEVHYLIFSQLSLCDKRDNKDGFADNINIRNSDGTVTKLSFVDVKRQIDTAIKLRPKEVRYLFARMVYLYRKLQRTYDLVRYDDSKKSKKIVFPERNILYSDCRNLLYLTNDKFRLSSAHYFISQIASIVDRDTIKAIRSLADAIITDSSRKVFFRERAKLKYLIDNYVGAIADFSVYLDHEDSPEDLFMRGKCYSELNDEESAINDYAKAIKFFEDELSKSEEGTESLNVFRLKHFLGRVYLYRAFSFLILDEKIKGCLDLNKAVDYGNDDALKFLKSDCQ